jgi:TIGR00159 family protein
LLLFIFQRTALLFKNFYLSPERTEMSSNSGTEMNGKFPEPAGNARGSVLHSAGLLCSLLGMWDWIVIKDALRAVVEIFILWVFLYQIYRAFHATRGARIMVGLFACFLALVVLAFFFQLNVISWILTRIFAPGLALALVVIFQPELRVGLAKLGSHPFFSSFAKLQRVDFLDNFCKAVSKLSNQRFGALFAFERSISMKPIEDSGVKLDAIFSPELALTIFHTKTALHDGGVVISGDRISAAACVFPVSQKEMSDRTLGLRHRAGVGMSEESDCVVVVVSEETGAIALAVGGKLERNLTPEQLKGRLEELLNISSSNEKTAIA